MTIDERYGAIEGGGTKFVLVVGSSPTAIDAQEVIPTTTPAETLQRCIDFFQLYHAHRPLQALGVGMFGPVDLHPDSTTYGFITSTPKAGWGFTDIVGPLQRALNIPVGWENDVNAAAIGEAHWGAARGCDPAIYLTVGTGVGGGVIAGGRVLHGLIHPEMGHVLLPRISGDEFEGVCPFHGRCLEGLVSGPAIAARAGRAAGTLSADDPVWELVAAYLGMALMDFSLILSPQRIVLGGGVIGRGQLLPGIRAALQRHLNNYLVHPLFQADLADYVVLSALAGRAGVYGALEIARNAARA